MKKLVKLLGIIAFVAVIGISMSACVVGLPPDTPTGLYATAASSSSIYLSWTSVAAADGYYVYRGSSAYGTYYLDGTAYGTSYTCTGLSSSTTYYFRVSAYNSFGESGQSVYDSATTSSSSSYVNGAGYTYSNPYTMSSRNTWYGGYISTGSYHYYRFSEYSGFSAYIEWEDSDKNTNSTYNADIRVGLINPSGNYVVSVGDYLSGGGNSSTRNRIIYSLASSGYYIIEVYGYSSGYYRIGYY